MISKLLTDTQAGLRNPVLPGPIGGDVFASPTAATGSFIIGIINAFIVVTALAALLYLVLGGLAWATSDGEKTRLEGARNKITQALIGLIIVASAWAFWTLILKFVGLDSSHLPFPTIGQ